MAARKKKAARARGRAPAAPARGRRDPAYELDYEERFAVLLSEFRKPQATTEQVAKRLAARFGGRFTREQVYQELKTGLSRGWLQLATDSTPLREGLKRRYPALRSVSVVTSGNFEDVAAMGAARIVKLLGERFGKGQAQVHIGFASGYSMSRIARHLARLLREISDLVPQEAEQGASRAGRKSGPPREIWFHALSASYDATRLEMDPNFFMAAFSDPAIGSRLPDDQKVRIRFVGLYAPSIIDTKHAADVMEQEGIKEARDRAADLDIVVTSASDLDDPLSSYYHFYHPDAQEITKPRAELRAQDLERLRAAKCVGHMLFLPLADAGPVDLAALNFALPTVLTLHDLASMVEHGKSVLLTIGVNHGTSTPKAILKTILSQEKALISDLVCDSRNAGSVLTGDIATAANREQ